MMKNVIKVESGAGWGLHGYSKTKLKKRKHVKLLTNASHLSKCRRTHGERINGHIVKPFLNADTASHSNMLNLLWKDSLEVIQN